MKLKTVSGKPIFPIGIGTWGIGGAWKAVYDNDQPGIDSIRYSISKGQNHIDSGEIYGAGHTDEVIGRAITGINRKDLFITDKLWETSVGKGKVRPAVDNMLRKLNTDYLDILYIHKPWEDWPWQEAIPQINELIDQGIVRYFGVSNFTVAHMKQAMKISHYPVTVNQLYFNLVHKQEVGESMQIFCKQHNIQIVAYRPLERGEVVNNKVVQKIARKHTATPAQIALSWLIHHRAFVIPMAIEKKYINQNIAAIKIKLSPADMKTLDGII